MSPKAPPFQPLAVADGIGLIFHIAWFIFQYQRTRKSTYKWNKKYEKAFKAANLTFKIQLPLFLLNLFSNTWKDIFNIWFALDDKISATIFMYTNVTTSDVICNKPTTDSDHAPLHAAHSTAPSLHLGRHQQRETLSPVPGRLQEKTVVLRSQQEAFSSRNAVGTPAAAETIVHTYSSPDQPCR